MLGYPPVTCNGKGCGAVLNPFADLHYDTKMWVCPLCATRNYFPSYYSEISPDQMPTELFEGCTTVEYVTSPPNSTVPPVYIFVVDTSITEDELEACKSTLGQALQMMPEESLIGLISFGTHVHVHELQESALSRVFVFRGSMEYTSQTVATQLGLHTLSRQKAKNGSLLSATKFLVSLDEAEYQIEAALESLQVDAHQPVSDHRKARCTGTALQVAASLVDVVLGGQACPVRLMLFVGGPCTEGVFRSPLARFRFCQHLAPRSPFTAWLIRHLAGLHSCIHKHWHPTRNSPASFSNCQMISASSPWMYGLIGVLARPTGHIAPVRRRFAAQSHASTARLTDPYCCFRNLFVCIQALSHRFASTAVSTTPAAANLPSQCHPSHMIILSYQGLTGTAC